MLAGSGARKKIKKSNKKNYFLKNKISVILY
jgi:hypothetical protein